jgi:hypothetical protein
MWEIISDINYHHAISIRGRRDCWEMGNESGWDCECMHVLPWGGSMEKDGVGGCSLIK